jgi:hypothetical protein
MKLSTKLLRVCASALLVSLLVACGGGGGGDTPAVAAPIATTGGGNTSTVTPPTPYTVADAVGVAGVGLSDSELVFNNARTEVGFAADFIQGFLSTNTGTFQTVNSSVSCKNASSGAGAGTLTFTVSKSSASVGFKTGDTATFAFNACDFGDGFVYSGSEKVTMMSTFASLSTAGYTVSYMITDTNRQFAKTGKVSSSGSLNVTVISSQNGNSVQINTQPLGSYTTTYYPSLIATTPSLVIDQQNDLVVATSVLSGASATFTHKIDGTIKLPSATTNKTATAIYATTTPLSGGFTAAGRIAPTAGVVRIKDDFANLQTETTISAGGAAIVKGDSDRNGTLDLTSPATTYVLLTQ